MEVPKHIAEKCNRIFHGEVFFTFSKTVQRFICECKDVNGEVYGLFTVKDEKGNFREIDERDFIRIHKARTVDPSSKLRAQKEIAETMKKRRSMALAEIAKKKKVKQEIARDVTKTMLRIPGLVGV